MDIEQLKAISKILQSGILYQCVNNDNFFDYLKELTEKYIIKESDSDIDRIYKIYIQCGNMSDTIKLTGLKNEKIVDALVYNQSSDIDMTLLCKCMHSLSNTKYQSFLQWQVDRILTYGSIDIEKERKEFEQWEEENSETIHCKYF